MASTQEENAALVEEFLTTVVVGSDIEALDIFLIEDTGDQRSVEYCWLDCGMTESAYWSALATADIDIAIGNVVASDEAVAVRGTITGTHRELVVDWAPSRRSFEISVAWFCRIENGHIVRTWSIPHRPWLVLQLDVLPEGT